MQEPNDKLEGWEMIFMLLPTDFCETAHIDVTLRNAEGEVIEARMPRIEQGLEMEVPEGTRRFNRRMN